MPDLEAKADRILFNYVTTYRTDYQGGELKAPVPTLYHAKPKSERKRFLPTKDVHTLTDWKQPVPFSLLHRLRPIVNTHPSIVQKKYEKTVDNEKLEAQKTRPRLVMTPAVGMDDIADPRAREILVTDMYISDMSRAMREGATSCDRVQAPFPGIPAPANPIVAPRYRPPLVSAEWRMESVPWDGKQLRAYCDPTGVFWRARDPPQCRACNESAVIYEHRKTYRKLKGGRH